MIGKLTKKQNELINCIRLREKECGDKIYLIYNDITRQCRLTHILAVDKKKCTINIKQYEVVNMKTANNLLEKGVLITSEIKGTPVTYCTLSDDFRFTTKETE
ncbi:hypothetical protein D3C76_1481990 [compost metagenome]